MITNIDTIKSLSEKEYYSNLAFFIKDALLYNSRFYEWIISNMYELFERDEDVLSALIEKNKKLKKELPDFSSLEDALYEYFKGEYDEGDCVALACIIIGFVSWKREVLAMEEYYELRDMFVPFNLPISISIDDLQGLFDCIKSHLNDEFILISRIGKGFVSDVSVSDEEIVAALDELNFSEEE